MIRGPRVRSPYSAVLQIAVPHVAQAALVDQVDDQLDLVDALEVGDLRLIAGLDQRLEAGLDQGREAAAEDDLLAEQVGLGLFLEGRFEDAGAGAADAVAPGQGDLLGVAGGVLLDGDQARHAAALLRTRCGPDGPGPWGRS